MIPRSLTDRPDWMIESMIRRRATRLQEMVDTGCPPFLVRDAHRLLTDAVDEWVRRREVVSS